MDDDNGIKKWNIFSTIYLIVLSCDISNIGATFADDVLVNPARGFNNSSDNTVGFFVHKSKSCKKIKNIHKIIRK